MPRLEILWQKYRDGGLSIVSVQSNQDRERGHAFIEEAGLTYHFLENEKDNDVVSGIYLSEGNPTTYLIDENGRVVSYHLGFRKGDEEGLEKEIRALLGMI